MYSYCSIQHLAHNRHFVSITTTANNFGKCDWKIYIWSLNLCCSLRDGFKRYLLLLLISCCFVVRKVNNPLRYTGGPRVYKTVYRKRTLSANNDPKLTRDNAISAFISLRLGIQSNPTIMSQWNKKEDRDVIAWVKSSYVCKRLVIKLLINKQNRFTCMRGKSHDYKL